MFDRNSIFTEIPKHRKPKKNYRNRNYRTEIVPNQIVNKFNVSKMKLCLKTCRKWFWVPNWSNWLQNIEIQNFSHFSKITKKNNYQKLSNFEYIYGHKCPPIGLFWRIFFGFFRYTETVFRRYYRNSPKLHFGWITELNRNFGRTLLIVYWLYWGMEQYFSDYVV